MQLIKKFIKYYKPYLFLFYADLFCALIVSVIDLSFPQLLRYLTGDVFEGATDGVARILWIVGITLLLMYMIRYFCQYFITYKGHMMGVQMETDMRRDLFNHYQQLPFSYYDKNNTGEMMSKLVADLFDISELAHHGPENLFISILKITGSFTLMLFISVKLTLVLLAITLFMGIFSFLNNRRMHRVFKDNSTKIAKVNARAQDSLAGIRVVISFANEDIESEKFNSSNMDFQTSKVSRYKMMASYESGNGFFQGILYLAILVYGGYLISIGALEAADLAVYALYIAIFMNPISVLISFTEQFQKGYAGFKRFTEVLETEPGIIDKPDAKPIGEVKGDITFQNVCFSYDGEHNIIDKLSFKIAAGRTVAFVGPSGGGKSTLCSLLPRFYDTTSGEIYIDGNDIKNVTLKSLRNAIGTVQQDVYMFSGSIRENIDYGKPDATDEEIIEAAKKANIHDFILGLDEGYDTFVGERGTRLSGGQKQRLAIARVFLKNPRILILDEATSALDNESERYIQESLEKLSEGRTSLVIAHRLSTIRHADEIIVLNETGIVERGVHADLLELDGTYAKYYNMQFEGLDLVNS